MTSPAAPSPTIVALDVARALHAAGMTDIEIIRHDRGWPIVIASHGIRRPSVGISSEVIAKAGSNHVGVLAADMLRRAHIDPPAPAPVPASPPCLEDAPAPAPTPSPTFALRDLGRLLFAFDVIRFAEFCEVLRRTIGATEDYARECWGSFREHPLGYCNSRRPSEQGEGLLALALEKIRVADETGRAIGCPGEGRCHSGDLRCDTCGDVSKVCDRDGCATHKPITDERLTLAVLGEFVPSPGSKERRRTSREHVVKIVGLCLGAHAHIEPARIEATLDAAIASGKVQHVTRQGWEGWLEAPLAPQKPGAHSEQCPINREFWNERAVCDPDVCAYVPEDGPRATPGP